jgi:hypothetical protein
VFLGRRDKGGDGRKSGIKERSGKGRAFQPQKTILDHSSPKRPALDLFLTLLS